MKIFEISRSFYPSVGGLEKFISDRVRIYKSLDIEYEVICTKYSTEKRDNDKLLEKVTYLDVFTPYNITPGLKRQLDGDYDIININQIGRYFSDYAACYAKRKGKKVIITPHLYYHTNKYDFIKSLHRRFIAPRILQFADKIICFTNYEREFWSENFNIDFKKLVVIPHYCHMENEQTIDFDIPARLKYLLYIGRSDSNKRVDLLIKAFAAAGIKDYSLILTIRLDDLNSDLASIVKANKNIRLTGFVSDQEKEQLLNNMAALILPSEYEAFGIVIFEASKYKKPIICSSIPVLKEITDPRGVIYFENNIESIKEALVKFSRESDSTITELGKINFENLSNYSFEIVREQYKDLFKEISG